MALPFTDAFTDSNGVAVHTHNARWVVAIGNFQVETNALAANGAAATTQCLMYYDETVDGDTLTADQYSEYTIGAVAAVVNANIGGACRLQKDSVGNGYSCYYSEDTNDTLMLKFVAGTPTQLGAAFTAARVANDVCRLEFVGNVGNYKVAGVSQGTRTDSTFTTGNPGGSGEGLTAGHTITTLVIGNLGVVPSAVIPLQRTFAPQQRMGM